MFNSLIGVAKEVRADLIEVYWLLIIPLVCLLIVLEFFKNDGNPNGGDILKRVVISVLMLISFNDVINTIGFLGDGIVNQINQGTSFKEVLSHWGPKEANLSNEWFNLREHILYVFSLLAYIIAYLGFFVAEALTQFVWVILYSVSPLMILAYVPKATANVTANLYKGLVKVIVWKILWTTLGVLLLKMASEPIFNGVADYIMNIVMNLCIGLAMLFIPMATKSLINDGLEGAASALSAAPGLAVAGAAKGASMKLAKAGGQKAKGLFSFASRPANNLASRGKRWAKAKSNYDQRVGNRIKQGKTWYSELGLNEEQKIEKQKNMRRYYAIKSKYSKK